MLSKTFDHGIAIHGPQVVIRPDLVRILAGLYYDSYNMIFDQKIIEVAIPK